MGFEWYVARRHLLSMRHQKQVSMTALIAVFGVGIGVAALVIVLSVFNGFSELLWNSLLGLNPHVIIQRPHGQRMALDGDMIVGLKRQTGVRAVAPFVASEGFVLRRPAGGEMIQSGVVVRGVRASDLVVVTDLEKYRWAGDGDLDLGPQPSEGSGTVYGMIIGRGLADRLGALLGTEIMLGLLPKEVLMGQTAQWRRYVVTGIFNTGLDEFDSALVFVSIEAAQRDLGWTNQISGIQLRLDDPFLAESMSQKILPVVRQTATDFEVVPWMDTYRHLYASIRLEKWFSFLVLGLIVAVAGFNIISIQTMTVSERRKEIGILKTLGATPQNIGKIFTLSGMSIGLAGVTMGSLFGFLVCWLQQTFHLIQLPGQLYIINALPVRMYAVDFLLIAAVAVGLCFTFTRFPSRDAASIDPVAALRE